MLDTLSAAASVSSAGRHASALRAPGKEVRPAGQAVAPTLPSAQKDPPGQGPPQVEVPKPPPAPSVPAGQGATEEELEASGQKKPGSHRPEQKEVLWGRSAAPPHRPAGQGNSRGEPALLGQ